MRDETVAAILLYVDFKLAALETKVVRMLTT
jgi:hypothetical protein